jgi:hypothetical protein
VQDNYSLLPSVIFTRLYNRHTSSGTRGAPEAANGEAGLLPPPPPKKKKLKKTHFVERMISIILCDLPFGQNQTLNLTDDCYIRILKNTIKPLDVLDETKKTKMIGPCV